MIRLILRQYLFDPIIVVWGIFPILLLIFTFISGDILVINHLKFEIYFSDTISINSENLILQYQVLIFFLAIVSFPKFFTESITPERISLVLTKSLSKSEFLFNTLISYLIITAFYSVISSITFGVLFLLLTKTFYIHFLLSILLTPLFLLPILCYIIFFSLATNSYGLTVFLTFIFGLVLSPAFHVSSSSLVYEIEATSLRLTVINIGNICRYLLPDVFGLMDFVADYSKSGILYLYDIRTLIISLTSLLPLSVFSIFLFSKKEF